MHPIFFFLSFDINLKLYHWMTQSYARHKASDELHEKVLSLGDKFVEVYIGKYQRPKNLGATNKKDMTQQIHQLNDVTIEKYLDDCATYLTKDIFKYISEEKDVDLVNIRDELLSEIMQTKYLFTLK